MWTHIGKRTVWVTYEELLATVASTILLGVFRYIFSTLFFRPIAKLFKLDLNTTRKFVENAWFTLYYLSVIIFAALFFRDAPWMYGDWRAVYEGFPHVEDEIQYPLLRYYYCVQLGFYVQALYSLIFIDERKKDFTEYIVHHLSTIILVGGSGVSRFHRVGTIILLIHDVVDLFLYSGKMFFELGFLMMANIIFPFIIFSFAYCRLYILPKLLYFNWVHDIHLTAREYVFQYDPETSFIDISSYGVCFAHFCVSLYWGLEIVLCLLVVLHCYWFMLLLKLAFRTLKNGGSVEGDIRDHDFEERVLKQKSKIA